MGEPSGFELGVWGGVGKASHREGLEFRLASLSGLGWRFVGVWGLGFREVYLITAQPCCEEDVQHDDWSLLSMT